MTNPMLAELDEVVRLAWNCTSDSERMEIANEMAHFILTRHATLADMAKRLDALRVAATEARRVIALDRKALFDCHCDPKTDTVTDAPGLAGLAEYDHALALLDAATQEGEG